MAHPASDRIELRGETFALVRGTRDACVVAWADVRGLVAFRRESGQEAQLAATFHYTVGRRKMLVETNESMADFDSLMAEAVKRDLLPAGWRKRVRLIAGPDSPRLA